MRLKGLSLFVLCLVVILISKPALAETPLQTLYKNAKKEGEVIVWSPLRETGTMLAEEFGKDFPGIKVKHFEIRLDDYVHRVIAEARQGIVSLDIGLGRYIGISPLLKREMIQSYNDWTTIFGDLNPNAISGGGRFLASDDLAFIVAYNSKMVTPEGAPTSWDDLLSPKWKGKIIVEPRANAFAYLGLKWGKEKIVDYLRKLKGQGLTFAKGGTAVAQQLAAGAGHLAVGTYPYKILEMKRDGSPVDWAKKVSPIGAMAQVLFVLKEAPHPNAAKLFAGWLATDRAQVLMNTKLFRGALNSGSSYAVVQEMERNKVEIVKESLENYKDAAAFNKIATKALGVLR